MTRETFVSHIANHPKLVFFKPQEGDNYFIQNFRNDRFEVPASDYEESSWEHLEMVLLGQRRPDCMHHITRIVGYYSMLHAWNKSKLAELNDRHKGNYGLPEAGIQPS